MIRIKFKKESTIEDSQALQFLNEKLSDEQIEVNQESMTLEGAKGDIMIAIEIASLVLSAVTTFISVLDYWKNQFPKYSISLKYGENTFNRENLSRKEFEEELKKARESSEPITLEISK